MASLSSPTSSPTYVNTFCFRYPYPLNPDDLLLSMNLPLQFAHKYLFVQHTIASHGDNGVKCNNAHCILRASHTTLPMHKAQRQLPSPRQTPDFATHTPIFPIVIQILYCNEKRRSEMWTDRVAKEKEKVDDGNKFIVCTVQSATGWLSSTRYSTIQSSTPLKVNSMRKLFLSSSGRYFVLRKFIRIRFSVVGYLPDDGRQPAIISITTTEYLLRCKVLVLWRSTESMWNLIMHENVRCEQKSVASIPFRSQIR